MLLSQLIDLYLLDKSFDLSSNSLVLYKTVYNRFLLLVGDKAIEDITVNDFKRYLAEQNTLSSRSKNTHYQTLRSLFTYALTEEYSDNHIMAKVKAPRFHPEQPTPLLADEIKAILAYTRSKKRLDAIVKLALDTGCRISEITAMNADSIDYKTGRISVLGKGSKPRTVYAGKKALKAIMLYRLNMTAIPLFVTRQGKRLHKTEIQRAIAKMSSDLEMHIHFHLFRHTYAYTAVKNGMSISSLSSVLGHSDVATTFSYVKVLQSDVQAMVSYSPLDNL